MQEAYETNWMSTVGANINEVERIAAELVGCRHAVALSCGYNYRFGKDGAGDVALLQTLCAQRHIALTVISPVVIDDRPVSATVIRQRLAAGDMPEVRRLLCRSWGLSLPVVSGQHLGGKLGMPTVNQPIPPMLALPRFGVYASSVEIGDETYIGVTNIGIRPTVGAVAPLAETWIQDFSGDLYGQTVRVYPVELLRPEQKFADLGALTAQVHQDAAAARAVFAPAGRIRAVLFDYDGGVQRINGAHQMPLPPPWRILSPGIIPTKRRMNRQRWPET